MTRTDKLLAAAQAAQVMPSQGERRPAPVVDYASGEVVVTLPGFTAKGDSLHRASQQLLSLARAKAIDRVKLARAALDEATRALEAIDTASASKDD